MRQFKVVISIMAFLSLFFAQVSAQSPIPFFGKQPLINGFEKELQGETISYYSIYPKYVKAALLTRCTDGKKAIEWETDRIPSDLKGDYAWFSWIAAHADGTSSGDRFYDLYLNDVYALTFVTHRKEYPPFWTFAGSDSTRLVFEYMKRDGADDAHGMAYLRVPLSKYIPGKAIKIKIVGRDQNSNDWFMTFKYSFKEKIDITPLPFLEKNKSGIEQPIQITVLHFGGSEKLNLTINKDRKMEFPVQNGFNVFEVPLKAVKEKTAVSIAAEVGNMLSMSTEVELRPVIYREIDLVHHAHTDIGYSHIQEDVIKIHVENIRRALKLIEKTKDYPEGSRFTWNIESAWAVENFLQQATEEERNLFITAVRNGYIVVSATYANILTGLSTPEEMDWITEYSRGLRDSFHLPVNTAMMSDVPGMSWSMVPALAKNGIRYFSNGPNYIENLPDKGDRVGHTIREQGNKAFWWKSATGKDSILFWTCGKGYSSWHGLAQGAIAERGAEKIAAYMNELDSIHYPYKMVQWRYNVVSDNGPTDSTIADFVKSWNEKYISPKLVLANVSDMFARFERLYGKTIPVLSGDFTPYWEDGAYSTAKEETEVRLLSEKLSQLEQVSRQKGLPVNKTLLYDAKRNIIMFHEHTWGAWCSISQPDAEFTVHQWKYKKRFADSAGYYVNEIDSFIRSAMEGPRAVTVVNTLPWMRTGYVEVNCPAAFSGNALVDDKGKAIHVQKVSAEKIGFIASDVPANGRKVFHFRNDPISAAGSFSSSYKCNIDSATGAVKSLVFQNREWVDPHHYKGLLQTLYVGGLDPSLFSLTAVRKIQLVQDGPVCKKLRIECDMQGANAVTYEISQYNGLNYIQVTAIIDKKPVLEKESVHIALPFALNDPAVRIGFGEYFISPEKGQIPGSNKDFFSVQRWLDVSNRENGVTIASPQGALFEVGEMIDERKVVNGHKKWKSEVKSSADIFLYAMNNYWHTNYKADQDGQVKFDLFLYFHASFDQKRSNQFGYETTQPLLGYSE